MPDQQQLVPQGKAAPRPSRRREGDVYLTPAWATETLLEHAPDLRGQTLLDPCCGDGRMAAAVTPERFTEVITTSAKQQCTAPSRRWMRSTCSSGTAWAMRHGRSASPKAPRGERRWLTRLPPTRQIMLGRVSFTGTGTDSAPCSWYIWTRERSGGPWAKGSIVVADQRPGQLGLEVGDGR